MEAATSRLEDVTIFQENAVKDKKSVGTNKNAKTISASSTSSSVPSTPSIPAIAEKPKAIKAYDQFIVDYVNPYVELSNKIDSLVGKQAESFKTAVELEEKFLWAASNSKKISTSDPIFAEVLKPINEAIKEVIDIKDANRKSKFGNNLSTVAEGTPVLGWICVGTPVSYIPDFKDSSQFWSNRVLKEYKDKDETQVAWVKSFTKIFDGLKTFVKEYETTGPTWKANGGSFKDELKKISEPKKASSPSSGAPAPAPPPPPPPSVFQAKPDAPAKGSDGGMAAVFSQINQGASVTSGLRKVKKSEMTHKNPSLRASSKVPAKKPVPPMKPRSLSEKKLAPAKKPKKELVDGTWMIENFTESPNGQPLTIEVSMSQSVLITNCESTVIQLKGKVNAITINSCKRTGVILDKSISSVDIIKCSHVELQVVESVPIISVDQTDSVTIYLSKTSLDTEIFSSSTTSMNIDVPDGEDTKELPAPEQLKHTYDAKTGKLVTIAVHHAD